MDKMESFIADLSKKIDVFYFTSNLLIDNNKFLKDGI